MIYNALRAEVPPWLVASSKFVFTYIAGVASSKLRSLTELWDENLSETFRGVYFRGLRKGCRSHLCKGCSGIVLLRST